MKVENLKQSSVTTNSYIDYFNQSQFLNMTLDSMPNNRERFNQTQLISRNTINQIFMSNRKNNNKSIDSYDQEQNEQIVRKILQNRKLKKNSNQVNLPNIKHIISGNNKKLKNYNSSQQNQQLLNQSENNSTLKLNKDQISKLNLIKFKRNYRITSDKNEEDPDYLSKRIIVNKIKHSEFDPQISSRNFVSQFKDLIIKDQFETASNNNQQLNQTVNVPKTDLLGSTIEESLLSRNEQYNLHIQRAKSNLKPSSMRLDNSDLEREIKQIGVQNLTEEIQQNEAFGFVPTRTLSRIQRVRNITYKNFQQKFVKCSNAAVVNVPPYLNYFEFRKNENIKQLAKDILSGDYSFEDEEEKLNRILFNLLNRSEKFSFILQTQKEKRVNHAKFISTMREARRKQQLLINDSVDDLTWLQIQLNKYAQRDENQTGKFNINEIFESLDTQRLLSDKWTQKDYRTISPSKKVLFITENHRKSVIPEQLRSPRKINSEYVKETVRDIVQKSQRKVKVNNKTFDDIREVDKQKQKFSVGIGKFLDLQDGKKANQNRQQKSIIDLIQETEFAKKQNIENFTSKEIVQKVKQENFENSVYINYLGKGRIWKPDKSYLLSGRKSDVFNFQAFATQTANQISQLKK